MMPAATRKKETSFSCLRDLYDISCTYANLEFDQDMIYN
jgi:hypothetical protein